MEMPKIISQYIGKLFTDLIHCSCFTHYIKLLILNVSNLFSLKTISLRSGTPIQFQLGGGGVPQSSPSWGYPHRVPTRGVLSSSPIRHWKGYPHSLNWLGVPPIRKDGGTYPPCEQTFPSFNITFPRTSYAVGKYEVHMKRPLLCKISEYLEHMHWFQFEQCWDCSSFTRSFTSSTPSPRRWGGTSRRG